MSAQIKRPKIKLTKETVKDLAVKSSMKIGASDTYITCVTVCHRACIE